MLARYVAIRADREAQRYADSNNKICKFVKQILIK